MVQNARVVGENEWYGNATVVTGDCRMQKDNGEIRESLGDKKRPNES